MLQASPANHHVPERIAKRFHGYIDVLLQSAEDSLLQSVAAALSEVMEGSEKSAQVREIYLDCRSANHRPVGGVKGQLPRGSLTVDAPAAGLEHGTPTAPLTSVKYLFSILPKTFSSKQHRPRPNPTARCPLHSAMAKLGETFH